MAAHATLAEIGVPYALVRVERDDDGRPCDAYLALNPWGRIPTLEDGDLVLTESAAICLYLAERYPDARLAPPAGSVERAELYRWLLWLWNTVQENGARCGTFTRSATEGQGVKDAADAELAGHYDRIDMHLAGREWLVGGERTVADFFLFMLTRWGRFLGPAAWERPNLQAHWLRTLELRGPRTVFRGAGAAATGVRDGLSGCAGGYEPRAAEVALRVVASSRLASACDLDRRRYGIRLPTSPRL